MIYPVYIYGSKVLREECLDITPDYPELPKLISDMFETMYASNGVGLAAPHAEQLAGELVGKFRAHDLERQGVVDHVGIGAAAQPDIRSGDGGGVVFAFIVEIMVSDAVPGAV